MFVERTIPELASAPDGTIAGRRRPEPFVAYHSRGQLLAAICLCWVLVLFGLWFAGLFGPAPQPAKAWLGWPVALLFGAAGISRIRAWFDRSAQVVVSEAGILCPVRPDATILWSDIERVWTSKMRSTSFLFIRLRWPERYPPSHWLGRLTRDIIAFGTGGLDRSFDDLVAAISCHRPKTDRPGR